MRLDWNKITGDLTLFLRNMRIYFLRTLKIVISFDWLVTFMQELFADDYLTG